MLKKLLIALLFSVALAGGVGVADSQINPYIDKGTHFVLPIVSDFPQGERVEIAKDKYKKTQKGAIDNFESKPNYEEEFKKDTLYRYKEKTYRIVRWGLAKHSNSGDWIESMFYESGMSHYIIFSRRLEEFRSKFKKLEP